MKKHIMSLMEAALLLTMAWLTGCDATKSEQNAAKAAQTQTAMLTCLAEETAATTVDSKTSEAD